MGRHTTGGAHDHTVPSRSIPLGAYHLAHGGVQAHLDGVEASLSGSTHIAGDEFTAADIMMAYPFTTFRRICPVGLADYPAIREYVTRLEARPAFQKATQPA